MAQKTRWTRGFDRLGIAIGALSGIVVLAVGAPMVMDHYGGQASRDYEMATCLLNKKGPLYGDNFRKFASGFNDCGYLPDTRPYDSLEWHRTRPNVPVWNQRSITKPEALAIAGEAAPALAGVAAGAVALFFAIFLFFKMTGWVISGFSKESAEPNY